MTSTKDNLRKETLQLQMGPVHPAMHGATKLDLDLDGERVVSADISVGYLHRGFEKSAENVHYTGVIPYTDRLNYVSPVINNIGFVLTVEKLMQVEAPRRATWIRTLMSEISRLSDHLTCLSAAGMEMGAFTVMLYGIEAREWLWELGALHPIAELGVWSGIFRRGLQPSAMSCSNGSGNWWMRSEIF